MVSGGSLGGGSLDAIIRRDEIAALAQQPSGVSLEEVAQRFGVSTMTIRRDLAELEAAGRVRRVRGGAVAPEVPRAFGDRLLAHPQAKEVIAQKMLRLLPRSGSVSFDASTTSSAIASILRGVDHLTVRTNSLEIFDRVSTTPGVQSVLIGGERDQASGSFVGAIAHAGIRAQHTDVFVCSAAALDVRTGSSERTLAEAEIKQLFALHAERTFLCIDSSKLSRRECGVALQLAQVSALVTELDPSDARLAAFREVTEVL